MRLKSQLDKGKSIPARILEGNIQIDSLAAFQPLFKQFPKDPALLRAYADMLLENDRRDEAAGSYSSAAKHYFDAGFILQGIVAKLLQWRIKHPAKAEMKRFFEQLRQSNHRGIPVKVFLKRLSLREMNVVFGAMELIRLPAGHVVSKVADPENRLFFVVSGTLVDSAYWALNQREKRHRNGIFYLCEDDFWGEIYPFEQTNLSQSHIEAATRTELLKLDKSKLIKICKKYPNVERGLLDLFKIRAESSPEGFSPLLRSSSRHQLPIQVKVQIDPTGSIDRPLIFRAHSRDISVGGISVVLDTRKLKTPLALDAFHHAVQNTDVRIGFSDQALDMQVSGIVAWSREVLFEGQKTLALGIRFRDMTPKLRGLLFAFAEGLNRQANPPSE